MSVYQIRIQFRLQPTSWRSFFFAKWIEFPLGSTVMRNETQRRMTEGIAPIIELASLVGWYPKHTAYAGPWLPIIFLSGLRLV